ncbi:MAG: DNA modification methylase [Firmicutes bacterium HGW-Firmicutes-16]|nr:MAG: DNA modification methylase [Firmicutes bacterium HGW-Firmicutes-16]
MIVEQRKIADLRPAAYNPRKALQRGDPEYEKIARSIEQFGYVDPIIINKDGTIIGGHQRCTVLGDLGYDEVDVVVVDLSKTDEKALNIALNKISGEWDEAKLKELLLDLDASDFDISITGYTQDDLSDLISKLDIPTEAHDDGFDPDDIDQTAEPITHRGDIWQLGRHRLMCGDSTDRGDMTKLMGAEQADLIITDPPYNVDYESKVESLRQAGFNTERENSHIENDKMADGAFFEFLRRAYGNMAEAARAGAAIYVFHADTETVNFRTAMKAAGFKIAECLIWEKNAFVMGRQDYHWRHEPILYGWKEGAGHYFIKDRTQDTVMLEDDIDFESMKKAEIIAWIEQRTRDNKDLTTVLFENKPHKSDLHPTMKPIELIGRLMLNSSKPGWIVLDSFMGSGSTIMAAEQLGRTVYGMEMDEKFCDVIIKRWEEFTGQRAVRLFQGE